MRIMYQVRWVRKMTLLTIAATSGLLVSWVLHSETTYEPVKTVAFTAEIEETSRGSAQQQVLTKHLLQAYRSDSSRATAPIDKLSSQSRGIALVPERMKVEISDRGRMKTTKFFPLPTNGAMLRPERGPRCEYRSSMPLVYVGRDVINGFVVYGYQVTSADEPPKKMIRTSWYAKDLACYTMKLHEEVQGGSGEVLSVFERSAVHITLGEPDPGLFEVPESYKEVPPSEMDRNLVALAAEDNGDVSAAPERAINDISSSWNERDAAYYESQRYR